jgi:hypothetical protein
MNSKLQFGGPETRDAWRERFLGDAREIVRVSFLTLVAK